MSISISYSLSLDAAIFLCSLSDWSAKHPAGDTDKSKAAFRDWDVLWNDLQRKSHFVTNSRQLERQGFIYHDRDKEGRVKTWKVTAKGRAMAAVIRHEIKEVKSSFKIGASTPKTIEAK